MSLVATTLARLLDAGLRAPAVASLRADRRRPGAGGADRARARPPACPSSLTYGLTESCSQVDDDAGRRDGGRRRERRSAAVLHARALRRGRRDPRRAGRPSRPAPVAADGWLHTGDLGELDERRRLRVTGRKADTIVSGGENVAPAEVEACSRPTPRVLEAAVLGRADPRWGEAVRRSSSRARARSSTPRSCARTARARSRLQGPQADRAVERAAAAHALRQAAAPGAAMSFDADAPPARRASRAGKRRRPAGCASRSCCASSRAPVSSWMIDASRPQPGQRVLELAAGPRRDGDAGRRTGRADRRRDHLRPGRGDARGRAGARGRSSGSHNVEFQVLNAEWIDLPLASVDVVAVPLGLHADGRSRRGAGRDAARAAPRRARGAGGVGRRSSSNPWALLPAQELIARGLVPAPDRAPPRAGAVRAGRPRARSRAARAGGLHRDRASRRSSSCARHATSPSCGRRRSTSRATSTTPCSRTAEPEIAADRGCRSPSASRLHRRRRHARDPGAHARRRPPSA